MTRRAPQAPPTPEPEPKQKKIRQPRSPVDWKVGEHLRERRQAAGMTLVDIANNMDIDGEPHSTVALWRERLKTEGESRYLLNGLIKSPMAIEGNQVKSAITLSEFLAFCNALGEDPARVLESAGLARPAVTVEDAIEGDPRLSERDRETALSFIRSLLRGR